MLDNLRNDSGDEFKKIGDIELSKSEFEILVKIFKNKFIVESCNIDGSVNFSLTKEAKDFLKKLRDKKSLR